MVMAARSKGYRPVTNSSSSTRIADSPSSSSGGEDSGRSAARTRKINNRFIEDVEIDEGIEKGPSKKGRRYRATAGMVSVVGSAVVLEEVAARTDSLEDDHVIFRVVRVPDPSSMALVPARLVGSEIGEAEALPPSAAAVVVSAAYFDPVIFLFISGFAMGQALEKFHITERLATRLLSRVATGGDRLAIVILCLGLFVSGALSNVATAVLLTAVVAPVARELSDSEAKRAILEVAFGCNVGGMITPVASPQNVIALVALRSNGGSNLSFMQWIVFALPICVIAATSVFAVLKFVYGGRRSDAKPLELTERRRGSSDGVHRDSEDSEMELRHAPLNSTDWTIIGIVCTTVFLWMIFDLAGLQNVFGSMGMVGLMAVVAFHSLGILTTEDWHGMQWSVLTLLGGGVALGNAVESSGLLRILADGISKSLEGSSVWASAVCFFICTGLVANFLSSTVCAIVALPVVAKVGAVVGHPRLFTVGCALMTSAAMGLPVSSFPNANAAGVVHLSLPGAPPAPVLQSKDFVKSGFTVALLILIILSTVGYAWAMFLGW
ncbi:Solute carrier 13 [Perkinsus olseni]|uniref:Solute carrier 13 n=1 Tax=Perkinsus olseni TaxID=32597 RepID=A0A7J6UGT5_PEROL|nr:Solute carrier 13 [Perkinsus olseni]KAF4756363.1 Solute carrier 13 [Perkinsus olseni]